MTIVYSIFIFYLGSLFASFAYLVGMRMPKNESIKKQSHCEHCNHPLKLLDVLPIFGFFIHLGRCSNCHHRISIRYLGIELLGGGLFLLSYLWIQDLNLELLLSFILITVLLTECTSDILYHQVIDRVWIVGLIMMMLIRIIQNDFWSYLLSSISLFSILFIFAIVGKAVFKKQALGGGDIKLYLMIGFSLSLIEGLLSIFFSAFIGLIFALSIGIKPGKEMAFVPMISIATMVCFWFGDNIINWYLNLLGM